MSINRTGALVSAFINKNLYVLLDETTNSSKEAALHVFIGILKNEQYTKPELLLSTNIANTQIKTIYKEVLTALEPFERSNFNKKRVKAVLTDGRIICRNLVI